MEREIIIMSLWAGKINSLTQEKYNCACEDRMNKDYEQFKGVTEKCTFDRVKLFKIGK